MQEAKFVTTLFDGKSNPNKVTVAFTMALNAAQKGCQSILILMVEAVELGKPGNTEGINIGAPFESVSVLMDKFMEANGKITICGSCMIHNGFKAEEMDPRFEIITAPQVIDLMMGTQGSMQVS